MEFFVKFLVLLCGYFVAQTSAGSCRTPPTSPDSCCVFPKHENEAAVIERCVQTHKAQVAREMTAPKNPGDPMRGCCIAECIMTGTGHTDLSAAKLAEIDIEEAKVMGMAEEWTSVIRSTAEMCANEATRQEAEFDKGFKLAPLDPADQVCHPKYVFLLLCTTMNNLWNCPAKYYTDTPECQALKDYFKTCEM